MNKETSPVAPANGTLADRHGESIIACNDATPSNIAPTPEKITMLALDERTAATPPKSASSCRGDPPSSCKRRRLASEDDENIGETPTNGFISSSARKLNYEKNESDTSDDSDDEDPIDREIVQMRQESILKKIQRLNYDDGDGQLLHTSASAKIFEFVKDSDIIAKTSNTPSSDDDKSDSKAFEGAWVYLGSGVVNFIKCLEEGYNCGMIRMELTKNGTLETLMCHELTLEEVVPMASKKGKAYTWRCKDFAIRFTTRTFAIRFDDDMDALKWKTQAEQSKTNNRRVRRGLDIPDLSVVDSVCSNFQNMSTAATTN